jgi:hypothetical protein
VAQSNGTAGNLTTSNKMSQLKRVRIERLPTINFMPQDGRPFDFVPNPYIPLPAAGSGAWVLQVAVPSGNNGFIKRIANVIIGGGFTDGSGQVYFQIFRNVATKTVFPNYNSIPAALGTVANPSLIDGLRVDENTTFGLWVWNVSLAGAGITVGGRLGGYFTPIQSEGVRGGP